ncbi:MAG: homoserine dehydrogenase [Nanoarchaeota archaeon]|nr:homoserine dehydrogenase [Nanoarchaeota archaeon]
MVKIINVGLIGLGTIGSGVVEILKNNSHSIEKRTKINLKGVCDLNEQLAKRLNLDEKIFTKDYKDLINNKDIEVIIELIGGYEPAHTIIIEAIRAKKHIITANKAVLAKYGYEIFEEAQKNNVNILFEAAVGGCIPIIKTIEETYSSDNIEKIYGILNGTTNYILTRMSEGMSYEDALKKAQELGFAEADPGFDVEGKDASQKLSILASLAFDAKIEQEILTEGITKITKKDIEYAKEMGYVIKLLAIGKKQNGIIELRTHPTMIPQNHIFASINDEVNAILFSGKNIGEIFLSGKGAGKLPTASVIVTDIIGAGSRTGITERHFEKAEIVDMGKIKSRYYLRFSAVDKPSVLAQISKILGDNSISIAAALQKEVNKDVVPIVIITHEVLEENLAKAVKECNNLDVIKEEIVIIRIEDLR